MNVLILGTLQLDVLIKPGKGWQEGVETLQLGVKEDTWVKDAARLGRAPTLEAMMASLQDSLAPIKFCTLLAADSSRRMAPATYASVEHIMELMLHDVWVPELAKLLVKPYTVVGQALPRWKLRFRWTLADLPYTGREVVYEFGQVNTVVGMRMM